MTVIQPIFYGGSGNGDIKLKSLTPQYSSMALGKNQHTDFTVTPELDLSKVELYTVSCDDSRVTLTHQGGDSWRVETPDEKIPKTITTQVHIRANDDSGLSVDVPLTLCAGLSKEEKQAWASKHRGEHKIPTADFEPVQGWKPFENYGSSPAEIIANCVRNKDYDALFVGDYFDETVNGTTYRWTIAEFNHYGRGEALMVPNILIPGKVTFASSNNTYRGSNLESKFNEFYNAMPASLKPYVLEMTLPWTNSSGSQSTVTERVFPPSEIEAFGTTYYSKESSSTYKKWTCFSDNSSRMRHYVNGSGGYHYWLRSSYGSNPAVAALIVTNYGTADWFGVNKPYGAFPCFCIG